MANSATHDALERLLQRFLRDEMPNLTPAERAALESQFEDRFQDLVERSSGGSGYSFPNLIGFGPEGVKPFDELPYPRLKADFDESVTPSQIHAAAELYFIYQNERMKVFQVVDVLRRLFALGRMKIQRGPGARGLSGLVYIDGELYMRGDMTGPWSARVVLKDPTVDSAVLETARGGILRAGLGFDE